MKKTTITFSAFRDPDDRLDNVHHWTDFRRYWWKRKEVRLSMTHVALMKFLEHVDRQFKRMKVTNTNKGREVVSYQDVSDLYNEIFGASL